MTFTVVGDISQIETIAADGGIRELRRLQRSYGKGRWRKRRGVALVQLRGGRIRKAELHW